MLFFLENSPDFFRITSLYIFNFFASETKGKNTKFIFTTHNVEFMKRALRIDEINFADKDSYGTSVIYPLTDYGKRSSGTTVAKEFIQGRFSRSQHPEG